MLDLDYDEDSNAEADANFVLTGAGGIVEVQATAEKEPFSEPEFIELHGSPRRASASSTRLQRLAIGQHRQVA